MKPTNGEEVIVKPRVRKVRRARRRVAVVAEHHSRSLRFAALMLGVAKVGLTVTPDEIYRAWDRAE